MLRPRALLLLPLLVLLPAAARAQAPLLNPGFQEGGEEGVPAGWEAPGTAYTVATAAAEGRAGSRAARIHRDQPPPPGTFGSLAQRLSAEGYRGRRVRLRGWARAHAGGPGSGGGLWLRVDRPGGERGFFDNMSGRPILSPEWRAYEVVGDVAADAEWIHLGALFNGVGSLWVDDLSLEVVGDARPAEGPRPLSERGVRNLEAFARLLGYVRYFHPADEAAAADWDAFAVAGVRAVESASAPAALAAVLDSLFRPVAPAVRVAVGAPPPRAAIADTLPVMAWRHVGVGGAVPSLYRSDRIRFAVAARGDSVAAPDAPWVAELGEGIRAVVPLAVQVGAGGTLPGAEAGVPALPSPTAFHAEDRAVRLAAVALGWARLRHFYPYFDRVAVDWDAELPRALRHAAEGGECALLATLRRMVAALEDGHGRVSHRCEAAPHAPPVALAMVEGRPTVAFAREGTGVAPGDVVLRIDGRPAAEVLREEAALVSASSEGWMLHRVLPLLLAGPQGSTARVEVERFGGGTAEVELVRGEPAGRTAEPRRGPVEEVEPGIWYVDLDRVADAELAAALPRLAEASGVVFDMRGYPAGVRPQTLFPHLVREPATSAQWHLPVVMRPDGMRFHHAPGWRLEPGAPSLPARRVFVTDGRAISYAESVMGIVEAYSLGEIVGAPTAGTNGNVSPFQLPGGYQVVFTGMKVLKHDGTPHHGVGIRPTVPAERTRAGVAAGRDELLERALEVVRGAR